MRTARLCLAAAFTLAATIVTPSLTDAAPIRAAGPEPSLPPQVLDAMGRDIGLSRSEVQDRLANESQAPGTIEALQSDLGASFGGAWLSGDTAELTVATTDASEADEVRAAGATPVVVSRSHRALDAARSSLDQAAGSAPASVTGWYVDLQSNAVVVETLRGGEAASRAFVAGSGVTAATVRYVVTDQQPSLLYDVVGGDAYFTSQFRCSIGFAVQGGFTTAGHCGNAGEPTSGFNQVAQGSFQASSFPGDDHAWVAVNSDWVPQPVVNGYGQGNVTVSGATEAAVGASVCRSGSTTGWQCGTIEATDQTVNYQEGAVFGLTQTSACAEGGDSGGSFISGNQAQGMTSGGSGNCTTGGTTFFQPVQETLSTYGLTLVTG